MARIAGVDLPRHKHIAYALPYLYGIGQTLAREICKKAGIPAEQEDRGAHRERDQDASASSSRPSTRSKAISVAKCR